VLSVNGLDKHLKESSLRAAAGGGRQAAGGGGIPLDENLANSDVRYFNFFEVRNYLFT